MTSETLPTTRVQSQAPIYWELVGAFEHGQPHLRHRIQTRCFRIGRRPDLELPIPSMMVSALHAELRQVGMVLFVRDLSSTNGTFVNGRRITNRDVPLKDGDRLRFGNVDVSLRRRPLQENTGDTTILSDTAREFRLPPQPSGTVGDSPRSAEAPRP